MKTIHTLPHYWPILSMVSGCEGTQTKKLRELFSDLPVLPPDIMDAALQIRSFLISSGWTYDDGALTAQDLVKHRRGNCLSLSLLFGAILRERGFRVRYRIVSNPRDANFRRDQKVFNELTSGDRLDFQNPALPKSQLQGIEAVNRFAPFNHPVLILDGKSFETTSLDPDDDPRFSPPSESISDDLLFQEVASNVLIDRARFLFQKTPLTPADILVLYEMIDRSLHMWGTNPEAWHFLWSLGSFQGNAYIARIAQRRYEAWSHVNSRSLFVRYNMTKTPELLSESLKRCGVYLEAFVEKHVNLEPDPREKRFNLAVALWCCSMSGSYDMLTMVRAHRSSIIELFGAEAHHQLLRAC